MAKFICVTPCFHNLSRYRKGDVAEFKEGQWPKDKDGRIRHFQLITDGEIPSQLNSGAGIRIHVNGKEREVFPHASAQN